MAENSSVGDEAMVDGVAAVTPVVGFIATSAQFGFVGEMNVLEVGVATMPLQDNDVVAGAM